MYQTPVPVLDHKERMCTYNVILYRNIYDSPVSMQIIYWGGGVDFSKKCLSAIFIFCMQVAKRQLYANVFKTKYMKYFWCEYL